MEFNYDDKRQFFERGYLAARGIVPPAMVRAARRAIHHNLGQGMDPEQMKTFRARSYCPELQEQPLITDLAMNTPAWSLAESLVGTGRLAPTTSGQIALRFPSMADRAKMPGCHLDGMHSPRNGVPEGTIQNFTMLMSVLLCDLPEPNCGNLTIWPGTHHQFERYFQEHGAEALLDGMPKIDYPEPVQVTGRAGDVFFVHYQIAHGVAPHLGPDIRYAVFFRLKHVDHDEQKLDVMSDIWREWDGMSEVVEAAKAGV